MKNKKIVIAIFMLISIINMVFLIYGFLCSLIGSHSFNESLFPSTNNIILTFAIILILQIINIALLILMLKKDFNKNKQLTILSLVFIMLIITPVVPVRIINSIEYMQPTNDNSILGMGSTIITTTYKNLYGITLNKNESTSNGMIIF